MWQKNRRMTCNWEIDVFIFSLSILNVAKLVHGQCDGAVQNLPGTNGLIQSPNFGDELGKRSSCSWRIDLPTDQFIVLQVNDLQLHFTNSEGRLHCMPSYILKVNEERLGCDPPRLTESESPPTTFCMQFHNPACLSTKLCQVMTSTIGPVEIRYHSDGATPPAVSSPHMNGFRIRYTLHSCQKSYSTRPALVPVETTQSPDGQSSTVSSTSKPSLVTPVLDAPAILTVASTVAAEAKDAETETPRPTCSATPTDVDATKCSDKPKSPTVEEKPASWTIAARQRSWMVTAVLGATLGLLLLWMAIYVIRRNLFAPMAFNADGRRRDSDAVNATVVKYTAAGGDEEQRNDVEVGPQAPDGMIDGLERHAARNPAFEMGGEGEELPFTRLARASGDILSLQRSLSNGTTPPSIEVNSAGSDAAGRITRAVVTQLSVQDGASAAPSTSHSAAESQPFHRNGATQGVDSESVSSTPSVTYSNAETAPYNESDQASQLSVNVYPFSRGVSTRRYSEGESPTPSATYSNAETAPYNEGVPRSHSPIPAVNGEHQIPARNCRRRRSNSEGRRHSETEVKNAV